MYPAIMPRRIRQSAIHHEKVRPRGQARSVSVSGKVAEAVCWKTAPGQMTQRLRCVTALDRGMIA